MVYKTYEMQALETRRGGKDITDIIVEALEARRGQPQMVTRTAMDLEVSAATLYSWCSRLQINIDDYKQPAANATAY